MFEFNPELVQGDDDEADDVALQREPHDDVRVSHSPSLVIVVTFRVPDVCDCCGKAFI